MALVPVAAPQLRPLSEPSTTGVPGGAAASPFDRTLAIRLEQNERSGRASVGRDEAAVIGSAAGPINGRTENVIVDVQAGRWINVIGLGNQFIPYAGIDAFNQWIAATASGDFSVAPPNISNPGTASMAANAVRDADGRTGVFVGERWHGAASSARSSGKIGVDRSAATAVAASRAATSTATALASATTLAHASAQADSAANLVSGSRDWLASDARTRWTG